MRFKESFNDTVYTVERERLVPAIAFSTGKWHWGADARTDSKDNENRLLMTAVLRRIIRFPFNVHVKYMVASRIHSMASTIAKRVLPACMPKKKALRMT